VIVGHQLDEAVGTHDEPPCYIWRLFMAGDL
jgi:hypothetical protein